MARCITLPRYLALQRHWRAHPRPEWLVAAYLGFKPQPETSHVGRVAAKGRPRLAPPTGAMQTLFRQFGGKPGKIAVIN